MILASLVLFPVLAQAQASTSTGSQPSKSSALLLAAVEAPAAPAASTASFSAVALASHAAVRESLQPKMADNLMASAMLKPGALEFALKGSVPTESSAPRLTRAVEVEISNQDLAKQPAVSNVVIRAIVDVNGIPRNVAVTQSAGSLIDEKAIAAVNQYRFQPATLDNKPTWATVSISIKIQKP
jgi:hypothetical protein